MWTDTPWEEIPSSETVVGLPRSHWGCHLHSFDWTGVANAGAKRAAVLGFMDAHAQGTAPHLLLLGRPGTGKTHLAVGLYRWAVYTMDLTRAHFAHVPMFSQDVKRGFNSGEDPFEDLERAQLVVLDDPFGREPTEWEMAQVIPRLIDGAYARHASLVVTANHDIDGFAARLHPHEMSRLLENSYVVAFFEDRDYRQGTP